MGRRWLPLALGLSITTLAAGCASSVATDRPPPPPIEAGPSRPIAASPSDETTFASTRYGYRLRYPDDWRVDEVPGSGGVHAGEPGVDTFRDGKGHILSVVGEPVAPASVWTCAIVQHLEGPDHRLTAIAWERLRVAGTLGTLQEHRLVIDPYEIHYLTVQLEGGGRGLTLSLESTTGDDAGDRKLRDVFLGGLEILP